MARTYKVTVYSKEDMLALENMSNSDIVEAIDNLDRGYFNQYIFPENDDDFKEYSEREYNNYKIRVALRKVYEHFEDLAEKEKTD